MTIYLRSSKRLTQEFPADQQFSDPSTSSTHDSTSPLKSSTVPRVLPHTVWKYSSSRDSSSWLKRLDFRRTVSNKDRRWRVVFLVFCITIDRTNGLIDALSKCTWRELRVKWIKRANAIFDVDKLMQSNVVWCERESDDLEARFCNFLFIENILSIYLRFLHKVLHYFFAIKYIISFNFCLIQCMKCKIIKPHDYVKSIQRMVSFYVKI